MENRFKNLRTILIGLLQWLLFFELFTLQAATMPGKAMNPVDLQLNVLTFNIRFGTADDGEDSWVNRNELVFEVLRQTRPDIVGLQEALRFQLDEICARFPEYAEIGVGRDDGKTAGEYSAILYLRDRFVAVESGTFWFSDTPDQPGSKHWGNEIPRICTWARLQDKETGHDFLFFNVHLDHASPASREKSVTFLSRYIEEVRKNEPFVVTGDFNAGENNPAILYLKGKPAIVDTKEEVALPSFPLTDAYRVVHPEATAVGTFNGFTGMMTGDKIDYILVPDGIKVLDADIVHFQKGGHYPSDHFPVTARILISPH